MAPTLGFSLPTKVRWPEEPLELKAAEPTALPVGRQEGAPGAGAHYLELRGDGEEKEAARVDHLLSRRSVHIPYKEGERKEKSKVVPYEATAGS